MERPLSFEPHAVISDVSAAVGGTPLVRLEKLFPSSDIEILAKLETLNPGGSTKDRPALAMVRRALADGAIKPGGTIVESSSGNLGVALARVCSAHGLRFVCVVDARTNRSTVAAIRALGGEVSLVTEPDPATGDFLTARLSRVQELLVQIPSAVNLHQYGNPANPAAHRDGTMREIAETLSGDLDMLMAAVSTTGTLSGCVQHIHEQGMRTRTVAVDAVGSVLFGGTPGRRPLPGMGAGVATPISETLTPDQVIRVEAAECVIGARLLARAEGILAGASTGGIVHALGMLVPQLAPGTRVAFVAHDSGIPYLDTVYDDDWVAAELGTSREDIGRGTSALQETADRD